MRASARERVCVRERESVRGRVARKQGTLYEAMKHEIKERTQCKCT